ncbi:hypothetical protein [Effusibacillus dendaii]|uniref:Uncharacterized protein n=1 Tax=Effusibacillus dendaii TaxID=2743772 RepID=A0A7I8D7I3_9BACL|nr:hypothetical protein [Effusibacillus dendaii]BCJ86108.1 hypothetical protein skT53_10930 [Effusibacillus dendaii]
MKVNETRLLQPYEEVEFFDELGTADAYNLSVTLEQNQQETFDPNSYVDCRWEQNKLRIRNTTGSPVYLTVKANS